MDENEFNYCLQQIKNGDNRGMETIYNNYYKKMVLTAYLEVNDHFIAEDIASNVLISIFKYVSNYGKIKSPNAWIYKCVKNAAINYQLQNAKYIFTELIDNAYSNKESKIDEKIDLTRAIEKLTKRQQEIVQLHCIYGLKIYETARVLGISIRTINRDIVIIRKELKDLLKF